VLLDTRKNTPKVEGVYFILRGDVLLVKRLRYKLKGDSVDVISDNYIKYPPETLTRHEMNELTIVGRVVWHASKF
jgi:phage repressor protein C with HTH and peptisase S24 domain